MAKSNGKQAPMYDTKPKVEITPEWVEENREALEGAGFKVVTPKEFEKATVQESAAEAAANELLGIDFNKREALEMGDARLRDVMDLVEKTRDQLDLIFQSTQYASLMSVKERTGLHFVRTFIRQLLNEQAPAGQASCLRECIGIHCKIADGVLADRAKPVKKKSIRLSAEHLQAAGIV